LLQFFLPLTMFLWHQYLFLDLTSVLNCFSVFILVFCLFIHLCFKYLCFSEILLFIQLCVFSISLFFVSLFFSPSISALVLHTLVDTAWNSLVFTKETHSDWYSHENGSAWTSETIPLSFTHTHTHTHK